jgi:hypothetical protein
MGHLKMQGQTQLSHAMPVILRMAPPMGFTLHIYVCQVQIVKLLGLNERTMSIQMKCIHTRYYFVFRISLLLEY